MDQFGEARVDFDETLRLNDGHEGARLGLAQAAICQQDWESALLALQRVLKDNPTHAEASRLLAQVNTLMTPVVLPQPT
jgi:hypothetical protein